jgi:nucleolar protein 56
MKYLFTNILGKFVYDSKTKELTKAQSKDKFEQLPNEKVNEILKQFKDKKYFSEFYNQNLEITKKGIKESVSEDWLIIQAMANVSELDKINNVLIKRLREWVGLYLPEFEHSMHNQEKFVELVIEKNKEELMKEMKIKESMGADLEDVHLKEVKLLAKEIKQLQLLRKEHENYLEKIMSKYCPNILELAGTTIGAKLIELGRSLKHLAMLPASTIQLLGAEKALFRHIKTGDRSPKYGIIFQHPFIQKAERKLRGKAARILADKLSLCARLDYFKGEFKAKEYREELDRKLEGKRK